MGQGVALLIKKLGEVLIVCDEAFGDISSDWQMKRLMRD